MNVTEKISSVAPLMTTKMMYTVLIMRQTVQHHQSGEIETADKSGEIRIWVPKRMCYYCRHYHIMDRRCERIKYKGVPMRIRMERNDYCSRYEPRL